MKEGIRRVLRQLGGGIKDALGTQWDIRLLNITAGATDGRSSHRADFQDA